jgi:hypothetical protein
LSDVRRADARSAQIGGPELIGQCFHVSAYSGEPYTAKFARNLLSKDDCRLAPADEIPEERPEMALVSFTHSISSAAKRLTRAGAGPDGFIVWPSGEAQGVGPTADAGEEVTLVESFEVVWSNICN